MNFDENQKVSSMEKSAHTYNTTGRVLFVFVLGLIVATTFLYILSSISNLIDESRHSEEMETITPGVQEEHQVTTGLPTGLPDFASVIFLDSKPGTIQVQSIGIDTEAKVSILDLKMSTTVNFWRVSDTNEARIRDSWEPASFGELIPGQKILLEFLNHSIVVNVVIVS